MDWNSYLNTLIIGLIGIVLAYLQARLNKKLKEIDKKQDERDKVSFLILDGVDKTGALADATAEALQNGKTNGHVTQARADYDNYKKRYQAMAIEELAKKV